MKKGYILEWEEVANQLVSEDVETQVEFFEHFADAFSNSFYNIHDLVGRMGEIRDGLSEDTMAVIALLSPNLAE